ncbi:hypothetical protein NB706_003422 [Xanthomonas sacchari]|nr:hypothetical protein [Xanthomonas sacchari]
MRGLQEHVAGGLGHAGGVAAHQACQRHRPIGIGDQQERRIQHGLAAIEQGQGLAVARVAHADRALQGVQVEGMHRLAQFQHHVLGDVHQQRQRTHAAAAQAFGHPQRRLRRRIQVLDHAAAITRRVGARVQRHRQRTLAAHRGRRHRQRQHVAAAGRGHVVGDAAHAEAVGAVGGELDLDAGVGQAQILDQRLADRRIVGQFEQAGRVAVQAQLLGRAQHAVGRDAAQLGRLDRDAADLRTDQRQRRDQTRARIGRAADDLQQFALPGIDPAHLQPVGLGMRRGLDDPRHHHLLQAVAERHDLLDLQADGGQGRGELLTRGLGRNVAAQPVFAEFHGRAGNREWRMGNRRRGLLGRKRRGETSLCVALPIPDSRFPTPSLKQTAAGTARRSRRRRAGR